MGIFTWINGILQPQKGTIRVNGGYQPCSHGGTPNPPPSDLDDHPDHEIIRRRGPNPPAPGSKPVAPAEVPCDEQMEQWKSIASHEWLDGGPPVSHGVALLAIAWARQQQAQSLQLPPPGAEPVATDEELMDLWKHPLSFSPNDARCAIYARGRADERTAILRALGVEP